MLPSPFGYGFLVAAAVGDATCDAVGEGVLNASGELKTETEVVVVLRVPQPECLDIVRRVETVHHLFGLEGINSVESRHARNTHNAGVGARQDNLHTFIDVALVVIEVLLHQREREGAEIRIAHADNGICKGSVGNELVDGINAVVDSGGAGGGGGGSDAAAGDVGIDDGGKAIVEGQVAGATRAVSLPQGLFILCTNFGDDVRHDFFLVWQLFTACTNFNLIHQILGK